MEKDALKQAVLAYEEQLLQIELAIAEVKSDAELENLVSLKSDIQQLIELTGENLNQCDTPKNSSNSQSDPLADEYALFMSEMKKEGAVISDCKDASQSLDEKLKQLEGTKCKAPYKHNWGDIVYHNAMICSILAPANESYVDLEVKVMFINPTHQEMLPCPFYLETDCKFSEELCRYSHGEVVSFSALQEYIEPDFESLSVGSKVLAKKQDKLWYRASIKRVFIGKCVVKFDCHSKDTELDLHDVFPLESDGEEVDKSSGEEVDKSSDEEVDCNMDDVINMSLMITPSDQALGEWEKYTKGVGSKLMEKMGYVIGTGLGKHCDGRIEPVTAVILPTGMSLDHCMKLRENSGGDKNLFSVEKKLKRLQKQQEIRNKQAYEREKRKVNMFDFLNETLSTSQSIKEVEISQFKHNHRQEITKDTLRDLNVASLKIGEDIKHIQQDLCKIKESLTRHTDRNSQMHRSLIQKLSRKEIELQTLQDKAINIHNEQSIRKDKRKLTVF